MKHAPKEIERSADPFAALAEFDQEILLDGLAHEAYLARIEQSDTEEVYFPGHIGLEADRGAPDGRLAQLLNRIGIALERLEGESPIRAFFCEPLIRAITFYLGRKEWKRGRRADR